MTTGGSTIKAIERVREEGIEIAGVVGVLDRLAGGGRGDPEAAGGAPYVALTTIDDVYPEPPGPLGVRAFLQSPRPEQRQLPRHVLQLPPAGE